MFAIFIDAAKIDVRKWFTDPAEIRRVEAMLGEAAKQTKRVRIMDILETMISANNIVLACGKFNEKELNAVKLFNDTQTLKQKMENITPEPKLKIETLKNGYDAIVGSLWNVLTFVRVAMADYVFESLFVDEDGIAYFYLD